MKISAIILNWNGKHLLEACLPSVASALKRSVSPYEIIVVDNGSSDGSVPFLKSAFPMVKIVRLRTNKGISLASNIGAKHSTGNVLLFLNNDISLERNSLQRLVKHFGDPKVFGVTPKLVFWDKKTIQAEFLGCNMIMGTVVLSQPNMGMRDSNTFKEPRLTFFATGGASLIDAKKFRALGGFDELFTPFYWEDVDLSYRAYKRGWTCVYDPGSVFYHKHKATLSKAFTTEQLQLQELKARFIFTWSNFYDPTILLKHFLSLPIVFARSVFKGKYRSSMFLDVRAFFEALKLWRRILRKRAEGKKHAKLSDKEALELINSNHANELAPIKITKFFGSK